MQNDKILPQRQLKKTRLQQFELWKNKIKHWHENALWFGPGQMLDLSVGKHEHNKNTQPTEWYCKNACSKHAAKSNLFNMHIHTLSLSQT
jgi:hypothetical protein